MMNFEDRKPKQLERIRKEHYNRVYSRQQQLMSRLRPLLNKSDIIEAETEPFNYFKKVNPKLNDSIKLYNPETKRVKIGRAHV